MNRIKQTLLTNWHIMRVFRLAIGIWALSAAIGTHDWIMALPGIFFLYQGITDTGCCGSAGCYAPPRNKRGYSSTMTEDAEYEEVK